MTTRRTTRSKAAAPASEAEAPAQATAAKPALKPQELARFLGLKDFNTEQMKALLVASMIEAQTYIGAEVPAEKQGHIYQQGVLHLAAKFYAAGTSKVEKPGDLPMVCRYFFELVRRELSGPAK